MMLFTNMAREYLGHKLNVESDFAYLDHSARQSVARVRELIEACLVLYPDHEKAELIARIRSGNNTHFKSALFELLLYSALIKLGMKLEPHPPLPNGMKTKPDFLVTTEEGEEFYLEAVLSSEINGRSPAAEAMKASTLDYLADKRHQNFMVSLDSEGDPETQPSGKSLWRTIEAFLNKLSPDEIQTIIGASGLDTAPFELWAHENWQLTIRPIPLKPEKRGSAKTLIGVHCGGGGIIDSWSPIRDTAKHKAGKYGSLDKPLVIAVNADSFHLDPVDEMQALFGEEQFLWTVGQSDAEPKFERKPNGFWYGPAGPQYGRVSGVWIFRDLNAYTVANRAQTIYLNPWAKYALTQILKKLPHAEVIDHKMIWQHGMSFREIFDLAENWPGD